MALVKSSGRGVAEVARSLEIAEGTLRDEPEPLPITTDTPHSVLTVHRRVNRLWGIPGERPRPWSGGQ